MRRGVFCMYYTVVKELQLFFCIVKRSALLHWLVCGLFFVTTPSLFAQSFDVEELASFYKKRPLKFGGGLSAQTSYYLQSLHEKRQPFVYQLRGNVNIALFESLTLPLQFSLNNYGSNFSYPTLPNRFSLHPSYRWIRAHIGDISMSLSRYTMTGYPFVGAGVELTPDKWQITCLGGRFVKPVKYSSKQPNVPPTFERWGAGLKTHYAGQIFSLGGALFVASDRLRALSEAEDSLKIAPKKNIAISLEGALMLGKLKCAVECGISLLTRDIRTTRAASRLWDKLLDVRTSTAHYYAIKAELSYTLANNTFGIGYERVAPDYNTLGAYYFNNDFENITATYARNFFSEKLKFALRGGLQYDDLNGLKLERNLRYVGAADLQYTPVETLDLKLGYSSFQSHRNLKPYTDLGFVQTPYEAIDTLNFVQRNQNADFSCSWLFQKSALSTQNISFSARLEVLANRQGERELPKNSSQLIDLCFDYVFALQPKDFNLTLGTNFGNNNSFQERSIALSGHLGLQKRFLKKKLQCQFTTTYSRTMARERSNPYIISSHWNTSYNLYKQHRIQAMIAYQYTSSTASSKNKWSVHTQLSYQFTF